MNAKLYYMEAGCITFKNNPLMIFTVFRAINVYSKFNLFEFCK